MKKTIIANWKMNPQTLEEARELFDSFKDTGAIICPPFVYLSAFLTSHVRIGAQDVFYEEKGAFTGEISAAMLKNLGVQYVLIGHSDRRYIIGESDEVINKKIKAALKAGLIPVLLIGERVGENREEILTKQLDSDLAGLSKKEIESIIFAYEPVWTISTNPGAKPDTPESALSAIKFIMGKTGVQSCLYGGSVNENNIAEFLKYPEISGAVVGGASLRKEEFANMLKLIS